MLYSSAEKESGLTARRGSQPRGQSDREKIAIDISVLKKQYDKLRERQKQAHIILSSAVSKQHQQHQNQQFQQQQQPGTSNVNKLLVGKNAIVSKGRRGPPKGAIPPARNQKHMKSIKSTPAAATTSAQQQPKSDETVQWKNLDDAKKRRNSMTWKEINSERRRDELKKSSSASSLGNVGLKVDTSSPKRRSDSSSYSEESDDNESSPGTSLCDDDDATASAAGSDKISPKTKKKRTKDLQIDVTTLPTLNIIEEVSPLASTSVDHAKRKLSKDCFDGGSNSVSPNTRFYLDLPSNYGDANSQLTSISQLSPLPDLSNYFTAISPIKTPCGFFVLPEFNNYLMTSTDDDVKFQVSDDGVSNEFFDRCYEDNLTSSMIDKSPQAAELSPSISSADNRQSLYKTQKSLSMDERVGEETDVEPATAINRSYSDGTFLENVDDFQKIIADNRRMLSKLTARSTSDDANRLAIVDEAKSSPTNLSDVEEEEIAAIDKSDENETEKDVDIEMCSDIQDIGNIQVLLRASRERIAEHEEEEMSSSKLACRKTNNDNGSSSSRDETVVNSGTSSSNSSNVTTVPAAQADSALADNGALRQSDTSEHVKCCSETLDEKSMTMTTPRVENEASAQATPFLSSLEKLDEEKRKKQIREEVEREVYCESVKSEHCNPSAIAKALGKAVATRELESPKFNEIQLMVQKLKEEMENEMKNSEEVRKSENTGEEGAKKELKEKVVEELKEKIDEKQQKSTTTNGNNNENSSSRSQSRESCEIIVEKMEPNGKLKNCDSVDRIEKITKKTHGKVVQIAIIVESEDDSHVTEIVTSPVEKIEKIVEKKAEIAGAKECEKSVEKKIDEENEKKTTPPNGDLEKQPSKAQQQQQQKIDNNSDDSSSVMTTTTTTVTTVKTTCENCQKRQKEESDSSTLDDCQQKKSATAAAAAATSSASKTPVEVNEKTTSSQTVKNTTPKQQQQKAAPVVVDEEPEEEEEAIPSSPEVEVKKVVESSKPTPTNVKHNQPREHSESEKVAVSRKNSSSDSKKKVREVVIAADCDDSSSRIVIKEKYLTSEEKSAVMELAELIKEREKEKIIELKRERSISPKTRSNRSSPTESIMSSASRHLYDHEPRSDVRRRDMYTSEHKSPRRVARKSVSPLESPGTSPGKNLRDTLSSIQNTIKYLDHVCRDAKHDVSVSRTSREKKRASQTPPRKYERVYDNIEKVCENDYKWMQSVSRYSPPPFEKEVIPSVSPMRMSSSSYDDDFYHEKREPTTRYSRPHRSTFDDDLRYEMVSPSPSRYQDRRRYDRSLSPAKTRYYDYDDTITPMSTTTPYRNRRDVSSSSLSPPRYSRSRTPTSFEEEDPCFVFKIRGLTTEQYLQAKSTLTSSRERLAASRERLNASRDRLNYSSSYADSREPYSYSKSPLGGSRERMNFSTSGNYSSLAGSRDRLNLGGAPVRSTFSDSREFLYSKSPLGASRERLNASGLSKSPYTSTDRLYSSRSTTNTDYDRYFPITPINRPFSSSSDRINSSGNLKSALSTSRERLEAANKMSVSYLSASREKLAVGGGPDMNRSKSPAIDNFYTPKPTIGQNIDAKYGFTRSPTNPTNSTTTIPSTHVSRAPTKSPVTVQSSASYLNASAVEASPQGSKLDPSPSKFVRFDMNHKSCSPVDYASTVDDQSSVATSYNDPAQFRPMPTGARKYDYLN